MALSGRGKARAADALAIDPGGVKIDNLEVAGPMKVVGANTLEFGAGISGKQGDAGKIGYGAFEKGSLCIVGAGTKAENRKIRFWAEGGATLGGSLAVTGALTVDGDAAFKKSLTVDGDAALKKSLTVDGDTAIKQSLTVDGDTTLRKSLTVEQGIRFATKSQSGGTFLDVAGGQEALRIVRGVVGKDGGIFAGQGFATKLVSSGLYEITFNPAFSFVPGASATQIYQSIFSANKPATDVGGDTRDNAVIAHLSADRMRVKTGGSGGGGENRAFTFIVIGPR